MFYIFSTTKLQKWTGSRANVREPELTLYMCMMKEIQCVAQSCRPF